MDLTGGNVAQRPRDRLDACLGVETAGADGAEKVTRSRGDNDENYRIGGSLGGCRFRSWPIDFSRGA